jgi:hypothetical protein
VSMSHLLAATVIASLITGKRPPIRVISVSLPSQVPTWNFEVQLCSLITVTPGPPCTNAGFCHWNVLAQHLQDFKQSLMRLFAT